jgi:hypothetical protein
MGEQMSAYVYDKIELPPARPLVTRVIPHGQKIETAERMAAVASLPKRLSLRRRAAERISAAPA